MQVSVTIIVRDGAATLQSCLNSIHGLSSDVVVVVDDRTTDSSAQIAREFGANVHIHKFQNFSYQHTFADKQTKFDWVLSIDADEIASPGLVREIKSLSENPGPVAFWIPRKNKIFGKFIKYSNWDPDGVLRLYNKNFVTWNGEVHEQIRFQGRPGRLKFPIEHENYHSVEEFIARQNTYSSYQAQKLFHQGKKFSFWRLFWNSFYDFARRYFWHTGFLDGLHGLFLSYLMAIYHLSVWIKLWEKQQFQKV